MPDARLARCRAAYAEPSRVHPSDEKFRQNVTRLSAIDAMCEELFGLRIIQPAHRKRAAPADTRVARS